MRPTAENEADMLVTIGKGAQIQATLCTIGASLNALTAPNRTGKPVDVVLGFEDEALHRCDGFFLGGSIGRYANRIAGASFELDGRTFALDANDGANSLHGGLSSWHTRDWELVEHDDAHAVFALKSPDGDQGCPGVLEVTAAYLVEGSALSLVYEAVSSAKTIVTMTNHAYFNLNGHGSGSIMGHRLALAANAHLPVDEALIPTGELAPAVGPAWDFRTERTIGEGAPAQGYDTCFVLADRTSDEPAARLVGEKSGIVMEVITNQPAIQLYTGNFLDGIKGKDGAVYGFQEGLCLEGELFPDAIHHPAWPSPILEPGRTYRWESRFSFGTL